MGYDTVSTLTTGAILTATINNPQINLCNWKFMSDFDELLTSVTSNRAIKILVVQSGIQDFFVAHLDLLPRPGKQHMVITSSLIYLIAPFRVYPPRHAS
jgi:enoyl-CoA hydratase/carnithine racemase